MNYSHAPWAGKEQGEIGSLRIERAMILMNSPEKQ